MKHYDDELFDRMVDWANGLRISPRQAYEKLRLILKEHHHGGEHIFLDNWEDIEDWMEPPEMSYLNMGDTYAKTIVLTDDYINGVKLMVSTWGDWYEQQEQHYCREYNVFRCGYCGHFTPNDGGWPGTVCKFCGHCVDGSKKAQVDADQSV